MRTPLLCLTMVGAALATATLRAEAGDMRRPKKLIQTGWDKPDSERLLQNLAEMEKRPFDGVVIHVLGHIDEKKRCYMRGAFIDRKWERAWFQPCIDNLKACKFKRFTDNFITIGANPGNVDWFDDAGWANIVDHWRIAAWVARQSGFKGILFDPEPYTKPTRSSATPPSPSATSTPSTPTATRRASAAARSCRPSPPSTPT